MTAAMPERRPEVLWDDGEFVLSRVWATHDQNPALLVRSSAVRPTESSLARLEHAHALRTELDTSWAARPTDLIGARDRLALRVEDPGGQLLATLIGKPWDVA